MTPADFARKIVMPTVEDFRADRTSRRWATRASSGHRLRSRIAPQQPSQGLRHAGPLPRTEVVSKVWDHIRANSLQDTADKLRAVFGQDRCTMFEMQKLLSPHLTAA